MKTSRADLLLVVVLCASAAFGAACEGFPDFQESKHVAVNSDDCVSCHRPDYESARQPLHSGVLPETCEDCHSNTSWSPARFHHEWELLGAHAEAPCGSCHTGDPPVYDGTPTECVGCHRAEYDDNPVPGHATFPMTCADCHGTSAWTPATGVTDHPFPLEGAHAVTPCSACHLGNPPKYAGTPTECVGCHRQDYDSNPFPGHDQYPTTCEQCHNTQAWTPASGFDHPWPLDGAHGNATCASCHGNPPVYAGTSTACVSCHRQDYDSSPYPGHDAFATTCQDCHTTAAWKPATGAHPENRFPTTGPHDMPCADCHNAALGPNRRSNADCVGCHTGEHTRARMDAKHREEGRYPTGSAPPNFCLDCHSDGRNRD